MNVNNVMLTGRIGNIDKKVFDSGKTVQRISLAYHNAYKSKSGDWVNETLWFPVVFWSDKELQIGTKVMVEGSLDVNKYKTKEGKDRSEVVILAFRVQVVSVPADKEAEIDK